jgi:hypothetical protein
MWSMMATQDRTAVAEQGLSRSFSGVPAHRAATRNARGRAARGECWVFIDAARMSLSLRRRSTPWLGAVGGGCTVASTSIAHLGAVALALPRDRLARDLPRARLLPLQARRARTVGGFDETMYGAEGIAMGLALKRLGGS